jgi:hypothetical protein
VVEEGDQRPLASQGPLIEFERHCHEAGGNLGDIRRVFLGDRPRGRTGHAMEHPAVRGRIGILERPCVEKRAHIVADRAIGSCVAELAPMGGEFREEARHRSRNRLPGGLRRGIEHIQERVPIEDMTGRSQEVTAPVLVASLRHERVPCRGIERNEKLRQALPDPAEPIVPHLGQGVDEGSQVASHQSNLKRVAFLPFERLGEPLG